VYVCVHACVLHVCVYVCVLLACMYNIYVCIAHTFLYTSDVCECTYMNIIHHIIIIVCTVKIAITPNDKSIESDNYANIYHTVNIYYNNNPFLPIFHEI